MSAAVAPVGRILPPVAAARWRCSASGSSPPRPAFLADVARPRLVPRSRAERDRQLALGGPLAARRQRLGDAARGARSASPPRVVLGVVLAAALHLSPSCVAPSTRSIVASQTIPIIVIAPILVVWFGFGIGPKIAIVALICFFPIVVNALDGLGDDAAPSSAS